ncbi:MaoC family dehydratase [Blastochloris sulfoviridis]|uniref:MaoC family dehydratase n=1 Tax=Blastochloris sulfoviridis TaxID=50712 RepID=A0A5M6I254_9HYPH|nr:MaoC family dehydratase [Blastochloris sulfoviridis]KAA5602233.1 MaoC family dehydratase [Blastochloris sulfoviridis]
MKFLEDIATGEIDELGSHVFTVEDIKRFAQAFDPQPFHLDEAAAEESHFGGLVASGWHTGAVFMQLWIASCRRRDEEMAARGEPVARFGPSPGFRNMRWLKPVRAGDVLSYRTEVTAKRPSASRPGWGLLSIAVSATNQAGELVFAFDGTVFLERRPA